MTQRRFWLLVHRINGLLLAGFLTIVGATGSLLAWKTQLERHFAPALFVLPAHSPQAERLDPVLERENVAMAYPWADVDMLDLSTKPDMPLQFSLTPKASTKEQPAHNTRDDEAYTDPYSDRVLGSRRNGDLRQGWKNVTPFVYAVHESLALGEFGTTLLGVAALLWTVDCFVGLYLTFPASRRRVERSILVRASSWPSRWGLAWLVRWHSGAFKRLYDLHRASGLWLWSMLLIFAWTGVIFNLPGVAGPVMHTFGGIVPSSGSLAPCVTFKFPHSEQEWQAALRDARTRMKQASVEHSFTVLEERFLSFDREQCVWTYRVRSTRDVDRIGNTQLQWPSARQEASFTAPTGISRADTVMTWMEAIHEAQIGGSWLRMLVCLSGVVTILLSLTGVYFFLRKLKLFSSNGRRRV